MDLEAIHPQVVATPIGVLGEDQWKRDERATVVGPGCQRREPVQPDVAGHDLRHRATFSPSHPDLEQLESKIAGTPQLGRGRGQYRLHEVNQAPDQALWTLTERQFGATGCAEQVGHEGELGPIDVCEKERGTSCRHDTAVDLGRLLVGVDWCPDLDEIPVLPELVHEPAQIGERHRTVCYPGLPSALGGDTVRRR